MLVFTRKRSQSIIIGDGNIKITLEGIRNGKSLLDIEVPDDMKIGFGKLDEETNFPKRDRLGAYIVTQLEPGSAQFDLEKDGVIIINGKIAVKVVEMRGDKVRLGIEAPREVPIHRQEVWEAIQAEGRTGEPPDSGSASEI
jgi:carbon storage regulator